MIDAARQELNRGSAEQLAALGGTPVRESILPYGRQWLDDDDIAAVVETLRSDWLTTGPKVEEFERAITNVTGSAYAVAVSNGTAALHAVMYALGVGDGDEVIVPAMTFAASANCVVYQGGTPVFVDVEPDTLLIDASQIEAKINASTKAIVAVDYAGQPCDYDTLREIADHHGLYLIADACHAIGGDYKGRPVGSLADMSTFSFHPVKHATTGEGGAITTDDDDFSKRMRVFRNHGITSDHRQRAKDNSWFYEMVDLGYNYRLSDIQCALGISQSRKLNSWVERRQVIARKYDEAFADIQGVSPLVTRSGVSNAYHLYVVQLELEQFKCGRGEIFAALRAEGIGVNVNYVPVHLHPFYRERLATYQGLCPVAEAGYERLLCLPMFPRMSDSDVDDVVAAFDKVISHYRR